MVLRSTIQATSPGAEQGPRRPLEQTDALIDPAMPIPSGWPCHACSSPVEPHDRFCPACGTTAQPPDTTAPLPEASQLHKFFRCQNCGSEVQTEPERRSYVCAFCDSTYVVEFTPEQTARHQPEFVIGFAVTADEARQMFLDWITENAWFRPGDLKSNALVEKQQGVYLPFWSFSMLATSGWSAQIGEHWWRTETYTVVNAKGKTETRTRQVMETEWWPLAGHHHRYYSGFLVSGSKGLPQRDAARIKPFDLPGLKRYEPYYLAGWMSEEYSIGPAEALDVCQAEFYRREQKNVAAFMPGDTHRKLEISTTFDRVNSDLCLLPVYVLSYRYRDKLYRFLVNGQTGRAAGDKPLSYRRIAALVIGVLLLGAIVPLVVLLLAQS